MSESNLEIVRRALEASNRRDWDAVLADLDPEVAIDDRDIIDSDQSRGHRAYLRWRDTWDASWESWRMEDVELFEVSDDLVVALFRMVVRGRGSGLELTREDALIFELADGKVRRLGYWNDQARALEEVARNLQVGVPTAKNHVHALLEKLGAASRGEAARKARGSGRGDHEE